MWQRDATVDLTEFIDGEGRLTWDAPAGKCRVLRIGYTLHGNRGAVLIKHQSIAVATEFV